jgi:hypothetical protein
MFPSSPSNKAQTEAQGADETPGLPLLEKKNMVGAEPLHAGGQTEETLYFLVHTIRFRPPGRLGALPLGVGVV